jgi:hypothetical protein
MTKHLLFATVALSVVAPSWPHHGTAPNYDHKKVVKVEGVVKEFWWRNPHSTLFVDGTSAAGAKGTFVLEMGAPKALADFGYNRKTFQAGDKVVITMWPSYATPTNGQFMHGRFNVNGKELRSANGKD